jgi:serine/threonine protein kinase
MLRNIISQEPVYPSHLSKHAKHLIQGLLHKDPSKRLGFENEFLEIKTHPFFSGLSWQKVERKEYKAPLKISLDKLYFDREFILALTSEEINEIIADLNSSNDI